MCSATASLRSSRPVNGSQLLASSVPIAARVASIASGGGATSVSRFSRRRTSGSSPAAAATRSMLKPALGFALSPLGWGAATVTVVIAFLALGAVGYLVYRLGALWFGRWAGLLAALIVLTREPVLSYGSRAYVDLPYVALVLGAVLVEA